ncbi:ABC transporter ATP-binding protein [Flavicella sediminum]|uniref:ABC transporter ATP-binding protein n=1 Tax=Flavicella sediminum TaxID=2585141 RepID=UPI00111F87AE|nr:ABC transporter ATP-binding protein [Flavicella sediminum]
MAKEIILKIENLSKQYRLGTVGTGTISHDLNRFLSKIRGKEDPYLKIGESNDRAVKGDSEYVWALKDISFEVRKGEVLGIVGKNGAGKSTLLKILSKVTGPTTGSIKSRGRIASLLEVGTGFHPEMTGKENVFLNGAILGMTKKEIGLKLDEIVEFSGCTRYIDTPVKRYSSGMKVRLAFAVAAFLEPDILVVDEVLAVGDAEFQKKAIGKMKDISNVGGRTVLFVSHNMASVKSLCDRAIVLENGSVSLDANVDVAISYYLGKNAGKQQFKSGKYENEVFKLNTLEVVSSTNKDKLVEDDDLTLITNLDLKNVKEDTYHITYHLSNELGETMFSFSSSNYLNLVQGENIVKCHFPKLFFQSGQYFLSFFLIKNRSKAVFIEKDIAMFNIIDRKRELGTYMGKEPGYIRPQFKWE